MKANSICITFFHPKFQSPKTKSFAGFTMSLAKLLRSSRQLGFTTWAMDILFSCRSRTEKKIIESCSDFFELIMFWKWCLFSLTPGLTKKSDKVHLKLTALSFAMLGSNRLGSFRFHHFCFASHGPLKNIWSMETLAQLKWTKYDHSLQQGSDPFSSRWCFVFLMF